jgi:hypothetical protein
MKQTHRISDHQSDPKGGESGSILVFLIILMVIFTALGVGMVSMFGTSVSSTFASNNARRAGYLAESGLRYTISEVRNAADSSLALTNIDDGINVKWFNVFPGVSRYRVSVYPYWSNTSTTGTISAGGYLNATVPNSGFPPDFAIPVTNPGVLSIVRLQVGSNPLVGLYPFITPPGFGSKVVTYIPASSVTIPAGVTGYANLAFPTTSSNNLDRTSVDPDDQLLDIHIDALNAIPKKNGKFIYLTLGKDCTYQTASLVGGNVRLKNITWTGSPSTITIPAGSYLLFPQAIHIDSTGDHLQTQKKQTDYLVLKPGGPPQNYQPPALTDAGSGFSNTSAMDLSLSGNRVVIQGYIATGGTHSYWAAFTRLGQTGYSFEDPEEPGRYIGYHVVPISDPISDNLRGSWLQYHTLSYDVQIKMGWDLNLPYAAQGVAIRWHESPDFHDATSYRYYQGYGITYMRYGAKNFGSTDKIPNSIKPDHNLREKLLLVLWEQKVNASGVPTKDWLAYAELGDPSGAYHNPATERHPNADPDQKVTGYQVWPDGRLNDNATLIVRVEDKFVTSGGVTTRCNEIKVFYGDASEYTFQNDSRTQEAVATNKERARYYPKWLEAGQGGTLAPINPRWPSNLFGLTGNTIAYWYNNLATYDYFTLTSSAPTAPYNTVTWVKNNSPATGFSTVNLLNDNCTIRTTDFTLDTYPTGRKEIGLIGMGDLNTSNRTVAFDDFYIQILGGY